MCSIFSLNINPNALSIDKVNLLQGSLNTINANIDIANNNIALNSSNIAVIQDQIINHQSHLITLDDITTNTNGNVSINTQSINNNNAQISYIRKVLKEEMKLIPSELKRYKVWPDLGFNERVGQVFKFDNHNMPKKQVVKKQNDSVDDPNEEMPNIVM